MSYRAFSAVLLGGAIAVSAGCVRGGARAPVAAQPIRDETDPAESFYESAVPDEGSTQAPEVSSATSSTDAELDGDSGDDDDSESSPPPSSGAEESSSVEAGTGRTSGGDGDEGDDDVDIDTGDSGDLGDSGDVGG